MTVEGIACLRCCRDYGGGVLDRRPCCDGSARRIGGAIRRRARRSDSWSGWAAGAFAPSGRRIQPGNCRSDRRRGRRAVTRTSTRVVGMVLALLMAAGCGVKPSAIQEREASDRLTPQDLSAAINVEAGGAGLASSVQQATVDAGVRHNRRPPPVSRIPSPQIRQRRRSTRRRRPQPAGTSVPGPARSSPAANQPHRRSRRPPKPPQEPERPAAGPARRLPPAPAAGPQRARAGSRPLPDRRSRANPTAPE